MDSVSRRSSSTISEISSEEEDSLNFPLNEREEVLILEAIFEKSVPRGKFKVTAEKLRDNHAHIIVSLKNVETSKIKKYNDFPLPIYIFTVDRKKTNMT